jgi:hypothetical protein
MIDARIPLGIQPVQIEGPLDLAQKGMSLRALMTQTRAQEADLADRPARNALAMRKAQMEEQRMGIDLDSAKLEQIGKASTILGQFASAVKAAGYDQNAWARGKQFLAANGAPEQVLASLPDQVDQSIVEGLITRSMTVKEALERGDYAALYPQQGQPQQAPQQSPGVEVRAMPAQPPIEAQPLPADGVPTTEIQTRLPDEPVTAQRPMTIPDDLRKRAADIRSLGTKVAFDEAKRLEDEAARMDERIWKERDQVSPVAGAPGVLFNKANNQYTMNGQIIPAEKVQEIADRNRKAGATSVTQTVGMEETPGRKKVDEKYAEEFVAWEASGGYADIVKQLGQLREVSKALETENLTGPITGNIPDAVKQFTNPEAIAARDAVEEVVQRNLRLILGAQFTEKEGERLIARAFNPKLSEAENKKRVDRLITQIETAAKAKQESADYFRENGTLTGWGGRRYTLTDFEDAIEGKNDPLGIR